MLRNTLLAAVAAGALAMTFAVAAHAASPGQTLYDDNCAACHQASGKGVKGAFPALAGAPIVRGEAKTMAGVVLNGRAGMPGFKDDLSDAELSGLLSYVRSAWGNKAAPVTPADIAAVRAQSRRGRGR